MKKTFFIFSLLTFFIFSATLKADIKCQLEYEKAEWMWERYFSGYGHESVKKAKEMALNTSLSTDERVEYTIMWLKFARLIWDRQEENKAIDHLNIYSPKNMNAYNTLRYVYDW